MEGDELTHQITRGVLIHARRRGEPCRFEAKGKTLIGETYKASASFE